MEEVWKDIKGYEGHYQVSSLGRVKSVKFHKERIMKMSIDSDGYVVLHLTRNNTRKNVRVHRLVAEAFIPNYSNHPQVNHKDEDKTNNAVSNLEWCDCSYNNNYGNRNSKAGKAIAKKLSKPIEQRSYDGKLIKVWSSFAEIKRELGFDTKCIWLCCKGICNKSQGYKWNYA